MKTSYQCDIGSEPKIEGTVHAIDPATGAVRWSVPLASTTLLKGVPARFTFLDPETVTIAVEVADSTPAPPPPRLAADAIVLTDRGAVEEVIVTAAKRSTDSSAGTKSNMPLCNLYVSMLNALGVETDRFGDSTGKLTGLTA